MSSVVNIAVVIFAKAPQPGHCKTRLSPALGEHGAADLAARMLATTLEFSHEAGLGSVILRMAPAPNAAAWATTAIMPNTLCLPQDDGDLGQRLWRASKAALKDHDAVLLVGTDCVELSASWLRAAAEALSNTDAVMHPSHDGGYTLLGLRRTDISLFSDMPWSTDAVAALTGKRLDALAWHYTLLSLSHDIDTPEDLIYLPDHWPLPMIR
jgi:hypothetical protein